MNRGPRPLQSLAASPTMVGAVTTLIAIVAVFLAYNANNGLPFVPVYRVSVDVPNSARLVNNNEVRIGGHRVGVVESIQVPDGSGSGEATRGEGAEPVARVNLKLDKTVEPLPRDSAFRVRYKSAFGLKYLEVSRGEGPPAPEGFRFDGTDDGQIASLSEAARAPGAKNGVFIEQTEFDDIYNTFDAPTRTALRTNLREFGSGFASRGTSLNEAIEAIDPVFRALGPVARTLTAPQTRLDRFFPELADAARIVAPVAEQQAELFTNAATAFEAFSEDEDALREGISEGVPTLETGVRTLPGQADFLSDVAELSRRLRPGAGELRAALPTLDDALAAGTPVLGRSTEFSDKLGELLAELEDLVERPATGITLERLQGTFDEARPLLRQVAPAQTVCNYFNYFFTFVPNALSERDQVGYNLRNNIIGFPQGVTPIGTPFPPPLGRIVLPGEVDAGLAGYSGIQADGRAGQLSEEPGVFKPFELPILHGNPYGPTGQRNADCQHGQWGYPLGELRIPGQPRWSPVFGVSDIPGSRGPTTLFLEQDGTKRLKDTRVKVRQP